MIWGASPGKGPELAMLLRCCDQPPSIICRKDRRRSRHRISLPARQSGFVTLRLMMMGVAAVVVIGFTMMHRIKCFIGRSWHQAVRVGVVMLVR